MAERILEKVYVRDIRDLIVKEPARIKPECSVDELLRKIVEDPRTRHVYVVDDKGRLVGSVRFRDVVEHLFADTVMKEKGEVFVLSYHLLYKPETAYDLMNSDPHYVREDTLLGEVIRIMIAEKINELPVVDSNKCVIGEINMLEIIAGYLSRKSEPHGVSDPS